MRYQLTNEEQLSRVSARLADAMELLQCTATTLGRACAILSELPCEVEEICLSLSDKAEDE